MNKLYVVIAPLVALVVLSAEARAEASEDPPAAPLILAVVQDATGSRTENFVGVITRAQLHTIGLYLAQNGGEVRVGLVTDDRPVAFERLRISEPPATVPAASQMSATNVFTRERRRRELEGQKSKADVRRLEHESQAANDTEEFLNRVSPHLESGSLASRSAVCNAVRRAQVFLNEPSADWSKPPRRVLMLLTDGIDNVGGQTIPMQHPTEVIVVNGMGLVGALDGLKPLCFESVDAAIRWITAEHQHNEER